MESPVILGGHGGPVGGAIELSEGDLVTWSDEPIVRVWDRVGHLRHELVGHTDYVTGALELAEGRLLTWSDDTTARIWDPKSGELEHVLTGHNNEIWGAEIDSRGNILTWAFVDTVRVWSGQTGAPLIPSLEGNEPVLGAMALRDGRVVVFGGRGEASLWEVYREGPPTGRPLLHDVWSALELRKTRTLLAVLRSPPSLRLLDLETEEPGPTLRGHADYVHGALELTDGRILTWSSDGTARIWPGSEADALRWADQVIASIRPLTLSERCRYYIEVGPRVCSSVGDDEIRVDVVEALVVRGAVMMRDARRDPEIKDSVEQMLSLAAEIDPAAAQRALDELVADTFEGLETTVGGEE